MFKGLGLKNDNNAVNSANLDIPDELPDLAENILKKEDIKEKGNSIKPGIIPDELPDLEARPIQVDNIRKVDSIIGNNHDLIIEEPKIELPNKFKDSQEIDIKNHFSELNEQGGREITNDNEDHEIINSDKFNHQELDNKGMDSLGRMIKKFPHFDDSKSETGYFSKLLELAEKYDPLKNKLISDDLFSRMQSFWEMEERKGEEIAPITQKNLLQHKFVLELGNLKYLESKWRSQKIIIESDMKYLKQKEEEIKDRIDNLKGILKEIKFYQSVAENKKFFLINGVVINSLQELLDVLKVIDDKTFKSHVNNDKNDFYNWIRDAVSDIELADKIKNTTDIHRLVQILEESKGKKVAEISLDNPSLDKNHYFILNNGKIIKNLKDLQLALGEMSDIVFYSHVNKEKNDFSKWIRDVFNMQELADRIDVIKNKEDIADILKIFL